MDSNKWLQTISHKFRNDSIEEEYTQEFDNKLCKGMRRITIVLLIANSILFILLLILYFTNGNSYLFHLYTTIFRYFVLVLNQLLIYKKKCYKLHGMVFIIGMYIAVTEHFLLVENQYLSFS